MVRRIHRCVLLKKTIALMDVRYNQYLDRGKKMPWDAKSFRTKHAKNLTHNQAAKAAEMANAMLRSGADEGIAIATAIKRSKGFGARRRPK